jgi:hypothetical protein
MLPYGARLALIVAAEPPPCSVYLNKTISGQCSTSRFGCGPSPESDRSMWVKRGCCGIFDCDGFQGVRCCSLSHNQEVRCACGPVPAPAPGGTFWVDAAAAPGGNGSVASPFTTLQACVDVASRASEYSQCRLQAGQYREAVTALDGVEIVGAGVGRTVLDGTVDINGTWAVHSGKIWKTTLAPGSPLRFNMRQLFVDGTYITEARWPNANLSTMLDVANTWATIKPGSGWGWVVDPAMAESGINFTGARATLNLGTGVFTWVRAVQNFSVSVGANQSPTVAAAAAKAAATAAATAAAGGGGAEGGGAAATTDNVTASFNFTTQLIGLKRPAGPTAFAGNRYFLAGVLGALDSPGEWHLQKQGAANSTEDWVLYVWAPDGRSPAGRVTAKARDLCISMQQQQQQQQQRQQTHQKQRLRTRLVHRPPIVRNLSFHGCTFHISNCRPAPALPYPYPGPQPLASTSASSSPSPSSSSSSCQLTDVELLYPTYDPWVDFRRMPAGPSPVTTTLSGTGALISRLYLANTNNGGLLLVGANHTLSELLIEHTDWLGSLDFPPIKIGFSSETLPDTVTGERNLIERATVRGFGNTGIATSQLANTIRYTHVSHGGLVGGDNACVHADNSPTDCNRHNCSKNWHHNWIHDCREKCARCDDGSQSCAVHHNVIFNCGFPLHNGAPAGLLLKGWGHHVFANTIFNESNGQGELVPWTKFGENSNSVFYNTAARRIDTKGGPPLVSGPNGSCAFVGGMFDSADGFLDWRSLQLVDPHSPNRDFRPSASSPLRGTGVEPPASDAAAAGQGRAPEGIERAGGAIGAPDIGAYEYGATGEGAWRPGCTFHPRCALEQAGAGAGKVGAWRR